MLRLLRVGVSLNILNNLNILNYFKNSAVKPASAISTS
jgi:hypothetical protein